MFSSDKETANSECDFYDSCGKHTPNVCIRVFSAFWVERMMKGNRQQKHKREKKDSLNENKSEKEANHNGNFTMIFRDKTKFIACSNLIKISKSMHFHGTKWKF